MEKIFQDGEAMFAVMASNSFIIRFRQLFLYTAQYLES